MYVLSLNSNTQKQNITCSRHDRAEQISIAHLALSNDHPSLYYKTSESIVNSTTEY